MLLQLLLLSRRISLSSVPAAAVVTAVAVSGVTVVAVAPVQATVELNAGCALIRAKLLLQKMSLLLLLTMLQLCRDPGVSLAAALCEHGVT
jgi:hypothetical protein